MGQRLLLVLLLPPTSFSVRFFEPPIIVLYASTPPNECVVAKYFRISLQYVRCPCNTMFLRTIEYSSLDRLHEMKEHKVTHTPICMHIQINDMPTIRSSQSIAVLPRLLFLCIVFLFWVFSPLTERPTEQCSS